MANRDKILKALECCSLPGDKRGCCECPYYTVQSDFTVEACTRELAADTLALLVQLEEGDYIDDDVCPYYREIIFYCNNKPDHVEPHCTAGFDYSSETFVTCKGNTTNCICNRELKRSD